MPANDPATQPLADASKDLLYPSDSDEPFTTFRWPAGPADARAALAANEPAPAGARIEEVSPSDFFGELADDAGFVKLQQAINTTLKDVHILRVGQVRVAIYLLGRLPDQAWAGLKTLSVET